MRSGARGARRAVRALPRERRRALVRALRAGRAVEDPRDAALAVAWAQRLQQVSWPRWALPRTRPHGWRRWLWLAHLVWILAAGAIAVVRVWSSISGRVALAARRARCLHPRQPAFHPGTNASFVLERAGGR